MSDNRPPYPPDGEYREFADERRAAFERQPQPPSWQVPQAKPPDPAQLFVEMAERIRRNTPAEFAGAILVVPPVPETVAEWSPVEILLIDPRHDEAHFWYTVKRKIENSEGEFLTMRSTPSPGRLR